MPPPDVDALVERRRLKRRLGLWRLAAFCAAGLLIVASFGETPRLPGEAPRLLGMERIAVVDVEGIIVADAYREQAIRDLADDSAVAALIVDIDSPGGTVFGSEALYHAIREAGRGRPTVAVLNGVAASGGYMAALAADYIVARESTIAGSIGVAMGATNFARLMDRFGVEHELLRSGPLKGEPNPWAPMPPAARAAALETVEAAHRMFVDMVAERRALDGAEAARLADGRVFTGAMARDRGLVDEIGGMKEALAWLETESGVAPGLPLRRVPTEEPEGALEKLASAAAASLLPRSLELDGLISLWYPLSLD